MNIKKFDIKIEKFVFKKFRKTCSKNKKVDEVKNLKKPMNNNASDIFDI